MQVNFENDFVPDSELPHSSDDIYCGFQDGDVTGDVSTERQNKKKKKKKKRSSEPEAHANCVNKTANDEARIQ